MSTEDAGELFRLGQLNDAIAAAGRSVQRQPTDVGHRVLLAELLLFAGAFERADAVILAAEAVEPEAALVVAEFRQLLRGAVARRQLMTDGRLPEFLGAPTAAQQACLQVMVALRAGNTQDAVEAAAAAEAMRPPISGTRDGVAFDDFRDADDLHGCSLDVLTTTGKYFWIATDHIVSLEFHPTQASARPVLASLHDDVARWPGRRRLSAGDIRDGECR